MQHVKLALGMRQMKLRCLLFMGMALVALSLSNPAAAQTTYREAMRMAEDHLATQGDASAQDLYAFVSCQGAIEERAAAPARVWCAIASRRAVSHMDRQGGSWAGIERDTVRRALWLNAVDGLGMQNNPWWGSPRSETVYVGDGIRGPAYTLIAVINRGEPTLPEFRLEGLARIAGVERARRESVASLRQRTLDHLISKMPETAEERAPALWAVAAVGLTAASTYRGEDSVTNGREVATRLRGLAQSAEAYEEGEDAMLAPALYLSEGWANYIAEDSAAAEQLLGRGAELCVPRLWRGAALCEMLERAHARVVEVMGAQSGTTEVAPEVEPPPEP